MEPAPAFCICGMTACIPRKTPRAFTSICSSQVWVLSRSGWLPLTPALLTRISIWPNVEIVSPTTLAQPVSFVTSSVRNRAWPPESLILATTSVPSASRISVTMTQAPSAANSSAVDAPIPHAAPVTIATLSLRRILHLH